MGELSRDKRRGIACLERSVSVSSVQKRELRGEFRGVSLKRFVQSGKHLVLIHGSARTRCGLALRLLLCNGWCYAQ